MSQTVIGIFEDTSAAQEAKAYLLANGFGSENVDISTNGSAYNSGTEMGEQHEEGFGDKISHFFSNLFEDEDEARTHSEAAKRGTTVTVHARTEDETMRAVEILDNFGAVDVNEFAKGSNQNNLSRSANSGEAVTGNVIGTSTDTVTSGADTLGTNRNSDSLNPTDNDNINKSGSIPVIEEELQVGKREVETGGVRLHSRIVSRPVEESIRLREEHVNVERTPVNRPATEADFADFKEGTIEEREHAERPVVAKEAHVVEEVSLNKDVDVNEETINETIRHTEVQTDNLGSQEGLDRAQSSGEGFSTNQSSGEGFTTGETGGEGFTTGGSAGEGMHIGQHTREGYNAEDETGDNLLGGQRPGKGYNTNEQI